MTLSADDLRDLTDLAIVAASQAGEMIGRSRPFEIEHKPDAPSLASQVVTEIDRRSEDMILDVLGPTIARFDLGVLTEERDDDGGRRTSDHFWCIDPLDGTLPFVEGTPGYAVSIALVARDGTPLIGVIYDPISATVVHAISGAGAFRNGTPWRIDAVAAGNTLSVFADRSFRARADHDALVAGLEGIAADMDLQGLTVHPTAGAVMNALGVLDQPPGCYFKFPKPRGGGSLWDFAATACVFREAGAIATDILAQPLDLNRADSTFLNHRGVLFASDQVVATRVQSLYRGVVVGTRIVEPAGE